MSCTSSENCLAPTSTQNLYGCSRGDYQHHYEVERNHRSRCVSCVRLTIVTFTIILLSFGVSLFSVKMLYPTDPTFASSMCLPCSTLKLSTDRYEDFRDQFRQSLSEDGEELECCADTTEQLQVMMDVVSVEPHYLAYLTYLCSCKCLANIS